MQLYLFISEGVTEKFAFFLRGSGIFFDFLWGEGWGVSIVHDRNGTFAPPPPPPYRRRNSDRYLFPNSDSDTPEKGRIAIPTPWDRVKLRF